MERQYLEMKCYATQACAYKINVKIYRQTRRTMHDAMLMNVIHCFEHLPPDHSCEEWIQECLWRLLCLGAGDAAHHAAVAHAPGVFLSQHLGQVDIPGLEDHGDVVAVPAHF